MTSSKLSSYDKFSVVSDEFRIRTSHGGTLTVFTMLLISYLVYTEVVVNFETRTEMTTFVNSTMGSMVELEFDVTFPKIACNLLYVDAADVNGQEQRMHLDKQHHVYKRRMNERGNPIGGRKKHMLGGTITTEEGVGEHVGFEGGEEGGGENKGEGDDEDKDEDENECGSCYGAGADGE